MPTSSSSSSFTRSKKNCGLRIAGCGLEVNEQVFNPQSSIRNPQSRFELSTCHEEKRIALTEQLSVPMSSFMQMPERVQLDEGSRSDTFGRFVLQPLEEGYGTTIG